MKLKNLFFASMIYALLAFSANAQLGTNASVSVGAVGGVFSTVFNGGTNNFLGATTNTYWTSVTNSFGTYTNTNRVPSIILPVAQHDNIGMSVYWFTPNNSTTNGSNVFQLVRSFDNGNTFETTPYMLLTNIWPTAAQQALLGAGFTNVTCYDIGVTNATHLGISEIDVVGVTGHTNYCTNVVVNFNLNNKTVWTVPAQR